MKKKFGKHKIKLSNQDKIYFPEKKISKGELIEYYEKIADRMLPHLKDRVITMKRYPDGIKKQGFFQKEVSDYFPEWIKTVKVKKKQGTGNQLVCQNKETLMYIANQGCITPHIWLSKISKLEKPDKIVFDLDPSEKNFSDVKTAAFDLKKETKKMKLNSFVMTTGSRGLHVIVPIKSETSFKKARAFARKTAEKTAENNPEKYTVEQRKNKRKGRVFLDFLRNSYAQTSVAPYSVRARTGAPVAVPIEWSELKNKNIKPQTFNIKNLFKKKKKDSWKKIYRKAKTLPVD